MQEVRGCVSQARMTWAREHLGRRFTGMPRDTKSNKRILSFINVPFPLINDFNLHLPPNTARE